MNVLYLCKRFYTNKDLVADKFGRNFEFPVRLAGKGHQVLVIAIDYRGRSVEKMVDQGVEFISIPLFGLITPKAVFSCIKQIKAFRPTHVVGSGDSHLGYLALRVARRMGACAVFDVYDYYLSFGSNRIPFMQKMFYSTLGNADLILCASYRLEALALQHNQNVICLGNGVDANRFKPLNKGVCRQRLGIKSDAIIVGYFGSMEPMRGVEYLVQACQNLKSMYPKVKLLIAGRSSKNVDLSGDGVDYRGQVSQDQVVEMINASDVVVIPSIPHPFVNFGNFCKISEYLACQVPIVATQVDNLQVNYPEVVAAISEAIVKPGNATALEKAIVEQLELRRLAPCPPRIYWDALIAKLEESLINVEIKRR